MRTELFDLGLELDYAREVLLQARIELADTEHALPPASEAHLEGLRATVREREAYLRQVLQDYARALEQAPA